MYKRPHEYDVEEYQRMVCFFMAKSELIMEQNNSDQIIVLFNMAGWQMSHAKYYSFIKKLAGIFQDQYPERLCNVRAVYCALCIMRVVTTLS